MKLLFRKLVCSRFLAKILSGSGGQRLLHLMVRIGLYHQGIGVSGDTTESGEGGVMHRLRNLPDRPLLVLDVGANEGQFTSMALLLLKDESIAIHSFEPDAVAFLSLRTNLGGDKRVTLTNCAVGATPGLATFYSDRPGSLRASLILRNELLSPELQFTKQAVLVETIDSYCARCGISEVSLLKIDVEGNEFGVLSGARSMLSAGKIALVLFEFSDAQIDARQYFRDYFELFSQLQMDLFRLTPSGAIVPVPKYNPCQEQFALSNYLAIRRPLK